MANQNFRVKNGLEVGIGGTIITTSASGLVGIGTTNPQTALHLGSGGNIRLNRTDNTRSSLIFHDNNGFNINANTSGDDIIINSGNVLGKVLLQNNSSTTLTAQSGTVLIGSATSTGTSSQPLQVTGGAYVSGSLGIGVTNPAANSNGVLQVNGTIGLAPNSQIRQWTNGDGGTLQIFATQVVVSSTNSGSYGYSDGASIAAVSNSDGTLLLDAGRASTTSTRFKVGNTSSNNCYLQLGSTLYADTGSGALGINTTSPLQKLHVLGNLLVAAGSSTGQHITQKAYELNSGTLSWEGSAGQLFSITNNLTSGSIFSVNDVSGIPSIDVNANGTVSIAAYGGNVGVGTTNPTTRISIGGTTGISFSDTNIRLGDATTGSSITSGNNNFFGGVGAGKSNTTGNYNNFFGKCSGYCNTTGGYNNFFGRDAGKNNTTGNYNNFFGYGAGCSNTSGGSNNFFGRNAGYCNTTGIHNNFLGLNAGGQNISGNNNNFFGISAGQVNSSGSYNNFFGYSAGLFNNSGKYNNFFGRQAGYCNNIGSCNNFIGYYAGYGNTSGNANNFIGRNAGCKNTSASNNIAIGWNAGTTGLTPSGLVNLTTTGNTIAIGNTNITNFYTMMAAKAFANTTVKWNSSTYELAADTSSIQFKTNVRPFLSGLDELLKIESVKYNAIEEPDSLDQVGFIAEQIDEIGLKDFVVYDNNQNPFSVSYDRMMALAVNAIKELSEENQLLKQEVIIIKDLLTHAGIGSL